MADFDLPGYEIYERIGKGGMATVYRALHLNLDREVAIKVMDPAMNSDEQFSERFVREARISARLVHPHILQIYDVNVFENHNYIAMELLSGGDLDDIIYGAIPQRVIYQIVEQMTAALDYAFSQGYVHRDIKPSNIMLRSEKEYVLADFGIARAANSGTQMTQTGLMVGTPSYMSPEQAKGVQLDGRSDLYALAILLFEMLTKKLPYESDSPVTTAIMHLTEEIPTLPENLAAYQPFMNKAMAKEADDRYQTGKELYSAFLEASAEFDDDAVLTPASPKVSRSATLDASGDPGRKDSQADQTRVSSSENGIKSRPYRLDQTSQRQRLVSGTYAGAPTSKEKRSSMVPLLLGIIVVAGLGYGGYTWWQEQQGGSRAELSAITGELAAAYNAMNEENLPKAATAFAKVLGMDSGNAAAQTGMSEIEALFEREIYQALGARDTDTANSLMSDYGLYFSTSAKWAEFSSALAQMEQEIKLAEAQAERLKNLLEQANQQIVDLAVLDAAATLEQVKALDPEYPGLREASGALVLAEAEAQANEERWAAYPAETRDVFEAALAAAKSALAESRLDSAEVSLAEATEIAPGMPALEKFLAELTAAREAIVDLLRRAELALTATAEDPEQAAAAATLYREVTVADPANITAQTGLDKVANYYINAASQAMAIGDFASGGEILTEATKLLPEQAYIASLLSDLPDREQAWQDEQLLRAEKLATVDGLIDRADAAMEINKGSAGSEEAAALYKQVLAIDPENSAARAGVSRLVDIYMDEANGAIKAAKFTTAGKILAKAASSLPGQGQIEQLQRELPGLEKKWKDQQAATTRKQKQIADARQRALETVASGRTALGRADLKGALQAYNKAAGTHAELDETIAFKKQLQSAFVRAIRQQMAINELDTAMEYLSLGTALSPRSNEWGELKSEIEALQAGPARRRLGAY